jgi:hypothetical protein
MSKFTKEYVRECTFVLLARYFSTTRESSAWIEEMVDSWRGIKFITNLAGREKFEDLLQETDLLVKSSLSVEFEQDESYFKLNRTPANFIHSRRSDFLPKVDKQAEELFRRLVELGTSTFIPIILKLGKKGERQQVITGISLKMQYSLVRSN